MNAIYNDLLLAILCCLDVRFFSCARINCTMNFHGIVSKSYEAEYVARENRRYSLAN